jgi:hypothetical protein
MKLYTHNLMLLLISLLPVSGVVAQGAARQVSIGTRHKGQRSRSVGHVVRRDIHRPLNANRWNHYQQSERRSRWTIPMSFEGA